MTDNFELHNFLSLLINIFLIRLSHQRSPQWILHTLRSNTLSSLAPTSCLSDRHVIAAVSTPHITTVQDMYLVSLSLPPSLSISLTRSLSFPSLTPSLSFSLYRPLSHFAHSRPLFLVLSLPLTTYLPPSFPYSISELLPPSFSIALPLDRSLCLSPSLSLLTVCLSPLSPSLPASLSLSLSLVIALHLPPSLFFSLVIALHLPLSISLARYRSPSLSMPDTSLFISVF